MSNVPVQVIKDNLEPTQPNRWDQEEVSTLQQEAPPLQEKVERVESVLPTQQLSDTRTPKEETTTIITENTPNVVDKTNEGRVDTIALETPDPLTDGADKEEGELITEIIAAHGTK